MSCIDIRGNHAARLCIDGVWVLVKQAAAYPLNRSDVPHYSGGITACDRWALSLPHRLYGPSEHLLARGHKATDRVGSADVRI